MDNFISFPKMGITFNIDPVAFEIFGFSVYWYGIIIALGMLVAMIYCFKVMKNFGINSDRASDVVIAGIIGGIAGARAYYILFSDELTFADFFDTRGGGLAIYGGIIGAFLLGLIMCKIRKVRFIPLFDVAAIGFSIGQAIGRWANFVNQEAFGSPTDLPWGMSGNIIQRSLGESLAAETFTTVHPCFLYESLWCAIGFVILHFLSKNRKFDGQIFLTYIAWYGFGRFFIEGLRTDSLMLGRLRVSQVFAAVCVIIAIVLIFVKFEKIKRSGVPAVLYVDTEESKAFIAEEDNKKKSEKNKSVKMSDSLEKSENSSEEYADNTEDKKDGEDN